MRPIRPIGPIGRLSAAVGLALCIAVASAGTVDDLVAKMPAAEKEAGLGLAAEIVKLGPEAVGQLCKLLAEPGKHTHQSIKAQFALHGLALYVDRPDAEAERKMVAEALVAAMQAEPRPEVRRFLIRQLQLAGKDEAVPALAGQLGNPEYNEPATQALIRIGTPAAVDALAKALPNSRRGQRITFIRALGRLRAKGITDTLLEDAKSGDRETRLAALWALANIGDDRAASVLARAAEADSPYERAMATTFYLLFAQRRAEAGDKAACATICRGLIRTRTEPRERHVVCNALRTLVGALGQDALDEVMAATRHEDRQIRAAALRLTETIPGEAMTRKWVEQLKAAEPAAKVDFLAILARRGDPAALPAVVEAMRHEDRAVRMAALDAAARIGGDAACEALLAATGDAERDVRLAAFNALGQTAQPAMLPKLIAVLLKAEGTRERTEAQRAIVAVAERVKDRDAAAAPLLAALPAAKGQGRAALLKSMARIGGAKALAAVTDVAAYGDDDAIRALSEWCDVAAARTLLTFACHAEELTHRVLAMRGYVRLVSESKLPDAQKVAMLQDTEGVAKRPEEERLVLAALAAVPCPEALEAVTPYLDDEALSGEAAVAVLKLASGALTPEGVAALKKVAATAKDANLRQQAQDLLASVPKPEELNVARGKPVKASVGQQGNNSPDKAVDGNATDKGGSAWFGARWPSWLEVDLQRPAKIDSAHVWFYWDGRFYQYKLDVSLDGKAWKTVVDASGNTTPGTERGVGHGFAPVEARYVRLHVLKNSANEAVHVVELKVYAAKER